MDNRNLIELTNRTLKDIRKYEVVTPSLFGDIFYKHADSLEMLDNFDKDEIDSTNSIVSKAIDIQNETKKSSQDFYDNVHQAKEAIVNKDVTSLTKVEDRMDTLLEKIAKLQKQVYLDELTNIYNRKYLYEEILVEDNFKDSGVIVFIDLDSFKVINDSYGHIVGDKVLMMISNMIKLSPNSNTIRYGGDEFIVISQEPIQMVKKFFEEVDKKLSKKTLKYQEQTFKVSISYGILSFNAGDNFSDIIDSVDDKMYQQKKNKHMKRA
jgi:diguanylate cyclase (GGDEF)-like protein